MTVTAKRKIKPVREYKLRLPHDLAVDIELEAAKADIPQSRVIIDRLISEMKSGQTIMLDKVTASLSQLLMRYGARMDSLELSEALLQAVDAVLSAKPTELQAKLDKLRLARGEYSDFERAEREQAAFVKVVRGARLKRERPRRSAPNDGG